MKTISEKTKPDKAIGATKNTADLGIRLQIITFPAFMHQIIRINLYIGVKYK